MREIARALREVLNGGRPPLADWALVVLVVQWMLNASFRERCQACSFKVLYKREPKTPFMTLPERIEEESKVERLD